MITLFRLEEHTPVPTDDAMYHACVQELFKLKYNKQKGDPQGRERRRGKSELMFVYFFTDYRSPYFEYSPKERMPVSLQAAGLPEDYKISDKLQIVIDHIIEIRNKSRKLRLVMGAQNAVDKLTEYFNEIDFRGVEATVGEDDNGDPISIPGKEPDDAQKVINNIIKLEQLVERLDKLEDQIKKDAQVTTKFRGDEQPGRLI